MSLTDALRSRLTWRRSAAGTEADPPIALRRNLPLVPADTIAGRALVTVIAIMTFLAALAAGGAVLINDAATSWSSDVSQEMTVQVRPIPGRDLEADARRAGEIVRGAPGVADVRVYSKAESEGLLEPWLGSGLDLGDLPIPRLIVVKLDRSAALNAADLRARLAAAVPMAQLDDHGAWIRRLATMAGTLVVLALLIFGLVLVAMALAVAFATRGAMAGNREILDVLHFVGAEDRFIAREFQRHFLRLGLRGGAIGGGAAVLAFGVSGLLSSRWAASAGGEQIEALFGTFALGIKGYIAIAMVAGAIAVVTGLMSRTIVFRHLRQLG